MAGKTNKIDYSKITSTTIIYKFDPEAEAVLGLPNRDLIAADVKRFGQEVIELSGAYVFALKTTKPKKGKAVVESEEMDINIEPMKPN